MQRWQFIIHEKIHIREKPYHYNTCGKGFTSRSNLTIHETMHIGEKTYHCSTCCKYFDQSNHMTSDERTGCQL